MTEFCEGYDANFVEEPADAFICLICHLVLRKPVLFTECSHRICEPCFQAMKKHADGNSVMCPYDRAEIDMGRVCEDKVISRMILCFKVKCASFQDGCGWVGELRDLEDHLENDDCIVKKNKTLMQAMEVLESELKEKDGRIATLNEMYLDLLKTMQKLEDEKYLKVQQMTEQCNDKIAELSKKYDKFLEMICNLEMQLSAANGALAEYKINGDSCEEVSGPQLSTVPAECEAEKECEDLSSSASSVQQTDEVCEELSSLKVLSGSGVLEPLQLCFHCMERGHDTNRCPDKDVTKCWTCKGIGHISSDCSQRICGNCDGKGHYSHECPEPERCRQCKEVGHLTHKCPQRICWNCEGKGHERSDCPEPHRPRCGICNSVEHEKWDCPKQTCWQCKEVGHNSSECPETICWTCKEGGHISAVCSQRICGNCDEVGHSSCECPKPPRCRDCMEFGHETFACPQRICENCDEVGHSRHECSAPTRCRVCKALNHGASDCPERICWNCDQKGHVKYSCPEPRRHKCGICNEEGHSSSDCTQRIC